MENSTIYLKVSFVWKEMNMEVVNATVGTDKGSCVWIISISYVLLNAVKFDSIPVFDRHIPVEICIEGYLQQQTITVYVYINPVYVYVHVLINHTVLYNTDHTYHTCVLCVMVYVRVRKFRYSGFIG